MQRRLVLPPQAELPLRSQPGRGHGAVLISGPAWKPGTPALGTVEPQGKDLEPKCQRGAKLPPARRTRLLGEATIKLG